MPSEPVKKQREKKKKKDGAGRLLWVAPLLITVILGAGLWLFFNTYFVVGGQVCRRDAAELDLRGKSVSVVTYEKLTKKLPGCRVYWDVPLSGGTFDCAAESIFLTAFSPEDVNKLKYFENLRTIDAAAASVTAEEYELLRAAFPGGTVRWSVPVGGEAYPCDASEIVLHGLSAGDLPGFRYFEALRTVDARACADYTAIMALREQMPELELLWSVPVSGTAYPQDAAELLVDDPAFTAAQLTEALQYLPSVRSVSAPENRWTDEEKARLREDFPEIAFRWPVTILGTLYRGDETEIDLSGRALTAADLRELIREGGGLGSVRRIDLTGCGVGLTEELYQLRELFPEAEIVFDFELCGVPVNSMDAFVDLTGVEMQDAGAVEDVLPFMPYLEKVDMSDCGLDDKTMDALNKKYEDVRFVWTLHISSYDIRTDDAGFIASMEPYGVLTAESIQRLAYCEDMICLDLGSRIPFDDLSFLYKMPQLKYLVLTNCRTTDITPVGSLKNLIYLEMDLAFAADLTPLTECVSLTDLNVTFCSNTDQATNLEVFTSMAGQLKRLWYSYYMIAWDQHETLAELMPGTQVQLVRAVEDGMGFGWRYNEHYYEMRDLLRMCYMDDYGRQIDYKIIDSEKVALDPEFLAAQRTPY